MEVEYSEGDVLIFSYLILIHRLNSFGGLRVAEAAWYEWVHWLPLFDGPPIAARLYMTNSAKRKRRKPPRSATDGALGRLQSNSTSMEHISFFFFFFWGTLFYHYASPTSWEAYRDRRLTTNFELWVEIFYVPTCFHVRIPKPCLSICLSAPR